MSPKNNVTDEPYRARVPADVDAPDKIMYGLTFRQIAILAVAGVVFYGAWRSLRHLVPPTVLLVAGVVLGVLAGGVMFLIFRDAKHMDKKPWWRRGRRPKVKPRRGHPSSPFPNDAIRGAGTV